MGCVQEKKSKFQQRHAGIRTNVVDWDHEVRDLKALLFDVE